jgi:hypothetical protein
MSRPRFKPIVYVLEKDNHFVTKVSTNTTDETPNVVFLRTKVRITPIEIKKTYEQEMLSISSEFESFARNVLDINPNYDKNYIFSVDVAEKSVKYKKTSHLRYDIFLKPKNQISLKEHRDILKSVSDILDKKLIELFKKYNIKWE